MTDSRALDETVALLQATLDATSEGIVVVNRERRVVLYNRQYLKLFGLTRELVEQGGVSGINAVLAPQLENVEELRETSRRLWTDPSHEVEDTLWFKDGRVYSRCVAPHRIGGRVVGMVASIRDVTREVRAEAALEQHRTFLEKAQEVAHVGSWVADLDGSDRLGWSAETYRIFGVPFGRFDGTTEAFFTFVHPDDRDAVRDASDAAANRGAAYDVSHRIVRPDGSVRWVHEKADIIRDAAGRPVRMIGTVQDMTEQRHLEQQLLQAQKMEAIGRLAGGIAHDLNNALTAIAGYAELALTEVAADHPARADVEEIRRAAERAGSVTRQLLAFSRRQMLEPRVFDLNDTVTSLGRMLARLLGADIEVCTRIDADTARIVADPGQVDQAIINLAVNARDAMPRGGRLLLHISIESVDDAFARTHPPMPPGRYIVLRISDSGHGMSAATQSRIFEPFFTTKEVGKGTGLGLSMVYGTVKQTGGYIFVDSEEGRGTTFSLFFPPAPSAAKSTGASGESRAGAAPDLESPDSHPTVLVVEDEAAVRNLVASSLRQAGYELLLAASAEEALEILSGHGRSIDLVLTDAIMPGRSGIELAHMLRADRAGLPVILMSGYTEESLDAGSFDPPFAVLPKPFTPRELRQRIRDLLDR